MTKLESIKFHWSSFIRTATNGHKYYKFEYRYKSKQGGRGEVNTDTYHFMPKAVMFFYMVRCIWADLFYAAEVCDASKD